VQDEANRRAATRNIQLQHALNSRVPIEQAKGMIAEHQSVNMHQAFTLLQTFARNNNLPLTETATKIVDRRLNIDTASQPRPPSPS
jgi:AmiR/NasT family two-component response regulator